MKSLLVLTALLIYLYCFFSLSQPTAPQNFNRINQTETGVKYCLERISKFYKRKYLTYWGHHKAWIFNWASEFGIDQASNDFLTDYLELETTALCYYTQTGSNELNMSLSPYEFKATANSLMSIYNLEKRFFINDEI